VAGANIDNLKFAINSGANPSKCTLFRYGNLIDPLHFINPSERKINYDILNQELFILCIARLELVKKIDDVIRVLAKIRKQGIEIKLLLVGEGREQEKLIFLATELNVFDYVIFCGNKDQQWLSSIIPKATIVISPHTGRALTEAALGGAPIAAYDIDWQSELIEQGITGELVPYGDWNKLAESAIKLIRDKEYAREMGYNLRVKTLELMDPIILNNHERIHYTKIISENKY
jgi:glycosyltransferase involved in cell wall biosynthesis